MLKTIEEKANIIRDCSLFNLPGKDKNMLQKLNTDRENKLGKKVGSEI